ncbi:putative lactoylglutathione lyase (Glo1) [Aspergillus clavatus NRRL 1]|uniref:Lactoylglutathione lyase (Glo1), putative n=1 Tax=Aspergillus clavatus (strain ATCC 1007 / CBS 513.65 / DSM 816 / NCTC 3887 / NRRL 1 / QM 1276 / 107) TaxID=344612 RepID=A1C7J8_ASPCL|nr:lactoylglutathione lyase (Glo1), putative [Aspergillus clavatus NRRL 1]EAW14369.1 lactoylglutathione lyase (Glo1), putative [Aspergillus clavatus NRRL 1]
MSAQHTPTSPSSSPFEPGVFLPGGHNNDPALPEHSPTAGFKLNHFMLRIRDPQRSLHFYIDLMGMRTVFTMNAGPFTLYYLGYPSTAEDRANLPAWAARVANPHVLAQTPGLLEMYHVHGTEKAAADGGLEMSTGNTPPHLGFGHLGFTVPDVPAAVERLRREGVPIVKELGDSSRESVPLSDWEAERGVGVGDIHPEYKRLFDQIAYVADPDGYLVELIPQNMQ